MATPSPRLAARFGITEKEGHDEMKTVNKFSTMMKLLKSVSDESPMEDEEFGPSILRLITDEIDVSSLSFLKADVLSKSLKPLSYSSLTQKHCQVLIDMGI